MMWRSGYSWSRVYELFRAHYKTSMRADQDAERMKAVARTVDAERLLLLDTAPAGAIGALDDPAVAGTRDRLLVNLGNMHATAFRLEGDQVYGLVEHHTGLVDRPQSLSLEALRRMPSVDVVAGFECSGNRRPWQGLSGNGRWTGVRDSRSTPCQSGSGGPIGCPSSLKFMANGGRVARSAGSSFCLHPSSFGRTTQPTSLAGVVRQWRPRAR